MCYTTVIVHKNISKAPVMHYEVHHGLADVILAPDIFRKHYVASK